MITNYKSGLLLVNKSKNKTSFSIVSLLRKITKIKKIGHAGTLDPFATGLMVMLIGKEYTKKSSFFINHDKTYFGKIHLGYTTKSYDPQEELEFCSDRIPTDLEVKNIIDRFQGRIMQIPPMYSAKKINGQKLYVLARKNITIKREPIQVEVQTKLLSYSYPYIELEITCSKGTYIRAIANDLGKMLGCGAYLHTLIRERCGEFYLKDAIDQNTLDENTNLSPYLLQ